MSSMEEDIGYIKACVEANKRGMEAAHSKLEKLDTRIDDLEGQLSLYRNFIMLLKSAGWIAVCLLTLKLGDIGTGIADIWNGG